MDFLKLGGKIAVITGAGRGIGRRIALEMAENGAVPVIVDIDEKNASAVLAEIRPACPQAMMCVCDVTDPGSIERMLDAVCGAYGRVDIFVNNAGILDNYTVETISEELWDRVIEVNLKGVFLCCRAAISRMKPNRYGKIVNICSTAARMGGRGSGPAYGASKGGVFAMSMNIARVCIPYGINVNMVAPGPVASEMSREFTEEQSRTLFTHIPMGRFGTPEDVANAVLFLSSDVSSYIAGAVLDVNGGMVMGY